MTCKVDTLRGCLSGLSPIALLDYCTVTGLVRLVTFISSGYNRIQALFYAPSYSSRCNVDPPPPYLVRPALAHLSEIHFSARWSLGKEREAGSRRRARVLEQPIGLRHLERQIAVSFAPLHSDILSISFL
jgi:hypothetical protein